MDIVIDLTETYSDFLPVPLMVITEDGIAEIADHIEIQTLEIIKSSQILVDLLSVGKRINRPTIITPMKEQFANLNFALSPIFKHNKKPHYIISGPFVEQQNEMNYFEDSLIPILNPDQKDTIFKKMATLMSLISCYSEKESLETNQSRLVDVFSLISKQKYELEGHESYVNTIFSNLIKTNKIDFIGVACKNTEEMFEIKSILGKQTEELEGRMFHVGEGVLGQAAVFGKGQIYTNIKDSPRFSCFHQYGVRPVNFFSLPVQNGEIIDEIYFGGTSGDQEISQELIEIIEYLIFYIKEKQQYWVNERKSREREYTYEAFFDLLHSSLHTNNAKSIILKLLDFSKKTRLIEFCCFTFNSGEYLSRGKTDERVQAQHNKLLSSGELIKRRDISNNQIISHYSLSLYQDTGVLSVVLNDLEEHDTTITLMLFDLLVALFTKKFTEPSSKQEQPISVLLKEFDTENLLVEEHHSKVNLDVVDIENMIDIESVINQLALTSREKEILHLILEGLNNQEVGSYLSISVHTVKNHITNIYKKLNVTDRVQAMTKIYRIKYGDE
ncbi:response regulator transcription factor [Bacillus sp. AK128]